MLALGIENTEIIRQKVDSCFKLSDIKRLSKFYYLTVFAITTTSIALSGYFAFASEALQTRFGYDDVSAGNLMSLDSLVAAFANVPVGFIVDRFGPLNETIILGSIGTLLSHAIFAFLPDCK